MKNLFLLFAVALAVTSCNMSYEKTKSGLRYKVIKGKGGEKLKLGDYVKFNQEALIPERDTVLGTTYGKMPGYLKLDTTMFPKYHFTEILPLMSVGDSAVVILSVDSLLKKNMIENYTDVFRRGGQISIRFRVIKKYASENEMKSDYESDMKADTERKKKEAEAENEKLNKEAATEVANQKKMLEEYFQKNKINVTKTPSGAYVEVLEKGNGPVGDTSMDIVVIYNGKLFKDGTSFDTNEKTGMGLRFSLGHQNVVKGFDEGLMYFAKGGRGNIYIPSDLAYGPQGRGPIPPNAPLKFEIRVHDLQKRTGGAMPFAIVVDLASGKEVQQR